MTRAIRLHDHGGPEMMRWEEIEVPAPGPGEARVRHTAVGLNYIDTYHRTGLYPVPAPHGLGLEAAGVVEALGEGVDHLSVGDRVAYGAGPLGRLLPRRGCCPPGGSSGLPDGVEDETAAALMLKGMTVRYLVRETFRVEPGMTVLWHAAAGGVGLIASQWLAAEGVTVIGTVGSEAKARLWRPRTAPRTSFATTREDVAERSAQRSPTARACPSSMTGWARRRWTPRWRASRRAACSPRSATPRDRSRTSISAACPRAARSTSPGRP